MARIDFKKYVKITSGVAGGAAASRRDLNLRLFTTSASLPYGQVLTCDTADGVREVFGKSSTEYKIAVKYLGFISKSVTAPKQISFVRYASTAAIPTSTLTAANAPLDISAFTGEFGFKLTPTAISGESPTQTAVDVKIDLGDEVASTYDAVAAKITTKLAILGNDSTSQTWLKGAGCDYVGGKFVLTFVGSDDDHRTVTMAALGTSDTTYQKFGFTLSETIDLTTQIDTETPVQVITRVNAMEDNFGMFAYVDAITAAQAKAVAAYNKTLNYKYLFFFDCVKTDYTDYGTIDGELWGFECVHGVYCNSHAEYAWWLPAAIYGSTDYTRANSTKTAMYYQGTDIAPSVGIKTDAIGWYKTVDAARLNYYGETMKSGSPLRFYQDGVSMNGVDSACEMNEIWFKDACETEIINLLILMEKVPANDNGAQMIAMMVDGVVKEALNNGTIIKGKTLSNAEKLKVDTLFNEQDAWKTLFNNGYKFQIKLEKVSVNGTQKWAAKYLLAYLMGEAVKYVEGSDLMF